MYMLIVQLIFMCSDGQPSKMESTFNGNEYDTALQHYEAWKKKLAEGHTDQQETRTCELTEVRARARKVKRTTEGTKND